MNAAPATDLAELVGRFHQETGFPTEADEEQKRLRAEWAEKLSRENLDSFNGIDLTAIDVHSARSKPRYLDRPGSDWAGMDWIQKLEPDEYTQVIDNIRYLCWSDDGLAIRYDAIRDSKSPRKIANFHDHLTSKLLSICHPDIWLPISTQENDYGRERMLQRLRLPGPRGNTYGQQAVDANNRLRRHLAPHFDDDPLAIASFLYWLLQQEDRPVPLDDGSGAGEPDLAGLADRLLVRGGFLEDLVALLEDKGQIILYGPPGTGKTYLARELAEALAPEDSCRALVQFHPSTSYEDFFEGYRPSGTGTDKGIQFRLTPGPLARMAERASKAPDKRHIMVIDEINRGNLPRVLGELLFLLEYRDESVYPLYRPNDPFKLPPNLWFIGTMNTADRSIALVDAALRRRFHFVPFFPDQDPIKGLLGRWLARQKQPSWIARLVDTVNDELAKDLDGSHLLLGPSHFMKDYGSTPDEHRERLRRIWEYNIEPFIEDQFFGDPARIDRYRFASVFDSHGPAAGSEGAEVDEGDERGKAPVASSGASSDNDSDGERENAAEGTTG